MTTYDDLINLDKQQLLIKYANEKTGFRLMPSHFAIFKKNDLSPQKDKSTEKNWKAHLNIHSEDLGKAWDLICPILYENAEKFKIVNTKRLESGVEEHTKELDAREKYYNEFLKKYENQLTNPELTKELLSLAESVGVTNTWQKDNQVLFDDVNSVYVNGIEEKKQALKETERMSKGTQVTIYIPPGDEKQYQNLFEKIEEKLTANNIRPGEAYHTDRKLGAFTSIRHAGINKYQDAVSAKNYNPDNVPDTFEVFGSEKQKKQKYIQLLNDIIQYKPEGKAKFDQIKSDINNKAPDFAAIHEKIGKMAEEYIKNDINTIMKTCSKYEDKLLNDLAVKLTKSKAFSPPNKGISFDDAKNIIKNEINNQDVNSKTISLDCKKLLIVNQMNHELNQCDNVEEKANHILRNSLDENKIAVLGERRGNSVGGFFSSISKAILSIPTTIVSLVFKGNLDLVKKLWTTRGEDVIKEKEDTKKTIQHFMEMQNTLKLIKQSAQEKNEPTQKKDSAETDVDSRKLQI